MIKYLRLCVKINAAVVIVLAFYVFLIPAALIIYNLRDPGLYSNEIPRCVFRWHKSLSPKYKKWARKRVREGTASELTTENISGT